MRAYTPETITEAVIEQMSTTPDPRLKEIMASAVKHLHAFARDVNLTPAEWIKGIEFMTKVGQMCTPGASGIHFTVRYGRLDRHWSTSCTTKPRSRTATSASLLGPFFRENTPKFEPGAQIAKGGRGCGNRVVRTRDQC